MERSSMIIARAQELWRVGQRRRALTMLKSVVRAEPESTSVRMALASLYRELNCPDQAGRWGIVTEGWTTPVEQDRLGRLLAPFGTVRLDVEEFLALPRSAGSYPDLHIVIEGPVAKYVAEHEARPGDAATRWSERLVPACVISWLATVLLWLLAMMAVFGVAVLELADPSAFARLAAAVVLWAGAGAFFVTLAWSAVARRRVAITITAAGCAACSVLAMGALALRLTPS